MTSITLPKPLPPLTIRSSQRVALLLLWRTPIAKIIANTIAVLKKAPPPFPDAQVLSHTALSFLLLSSRYIRDNNVLKEPKEFAHLYRMLVLVVLQMRGQLLLELSPFLSIYQQLYQHTSIKNRLVSEWLLPLASNISLHLFYQNGKESTPSFISSFYENTRGLSLSSSTNNNPPLLNFALNAWIASIRTFAIGYIAIKPLVIKRKPNFKEEIKNIASSSAVQAITGTLNFLLNEASAASVGDNASLSLLVRLVPPIVQTVLQKTIDAKNELPINIALSSYASQCYVNLLGHSIGLPTSTSSSSFSPLNVFATAYLLLAANKQVPASGLVAVLMDAI